jgi:hypothetical protein
MVTASGEALEKYCSKTDKDEALVVSIQPSDPIRQIISDLALEAGAAPRAIICAHHDRTLEHDPLTTRVQDFLRDNYSAVPILKDDEMFGSLFLYMRKS